MQPLSLSWVGDTSQPVSLDDVKTQLSISNEDFDSLIAAFHIPAAVRWAENETHRSIMAKTHTWVLSDFPRTMDQAIHLPRGKTQSITSIAYTSNNATTTLTGPTASPQGTDFREDLRGDNGGRIYPANNSDWPSVDLYAPSPVVITFVAGWNPGEVPPDIAAAIMLYVGERIDMAGPADAPKPEQMQVKSTMLSAWRLSKLYS